MTPEQISLYQEIAKTLSACKYGEKQQYLKTVSRQIGLSLQVLYRHLEAVGFKSGKKPRQDRGTTHIDLDDARLICGMLHHTQRKNEKRLLSCQRAIEMAFANQQIKALYHPSTLLRVAKAHGFHPDQLAQPTPHIQMASLHPNHVWQVDASIGTLFYLPKGGVQFFDEREHYKNKPQNLEKVHKHMCIRYVITDHYSGAIYVKYYSDRGENQHILFDVLVSAFEQKADLLHGVPFMLVMDKGSANIAHSVTAFLNKMQVVHYAHSTGNSRAKGSVEKAQDIIERDFEGGLRLMQTPVQHVDQLNTLALKWMHFFNNTAIHSRHKQTRATLWSTIKADELRLAPAREIMEMLLTHKPVARRVNGDLTITFKARGFDTAKRYSVEHIPTIKVHDEIMVSISPYRAPNIDVMITGFDGKETYYECTPLAVNAAGFYEGAAVFGLDKRTAIDTVTDIERKNSFKAAYDGATTLTEAKIKQKKGTQLYGGKIDPFKHVNAHLEAQKNVTTLPKRGTTLEITPPQQVLEPISVAEACKRIKAVLGDQYPHDTYTRLRQQYPNGIDPMQLNRIAQSLQPISHLKMTNQ